MSEDTIGWARVLVPRYTAKGQYEAMIAHNVRRTYQAGSVRTDQVPEGLKVTAGTREDLITHARKGTIVAVLHAHLWAEPSLRGKRGGTRQDFWTALDALEAKGAVLWELYTGLRTDKRGQRDKITREAVETLARGRHKTRMSDKRGRPSKEFTEAEWDKAERAWFDKRLKIWDAVKQKLPKGMTLKRAWAKFGPRNVETG